MSQLGPNAQWILIVGSIGVAAFGILAVIFGRKKK